ncbi:MAG: hypothetical protein ACK40L_01295 [Hydrogenophaga sp.]
MMHHVFPPVPVFLSRPPLRAGLLAVALLVAVSAGAQGPVGKAEIETRFQQDKAACMAVDGAQERTSCLREAGAVRAEALRGMTQGGESAEMRLRNALQRCNPLPPDRKAICERMVRGEGSTSGSVAGGGMIRELTVMEPVAPLPPGAQPLPPAATPVR